MVRETTRLADYHLHIDTCASCFTLQEPVSLCEIGQMLLTEVVEAEELQP